MSGAIDDTEKDVLSVRGYNNARKIGLKIFLTGLGLHPIALDEEDDRALTIIEKFEYCASTWTFVFVLA